MIIEKKFFVVIDLDEMDFVKNTKYYTLTPNIEEAKRFETKEDSEDFIKDAGIFSLQTLFCETKSNLYPVIEEDFDFELVDECFDDCYSENDCCNNNCNNCSCES